MGSKKNLTQIYFDKVPKEWDSLYSNENCMMYVLNKFLRKGLFDRYELTFNICEPIEGKEVLDIGCGSGRYSVEFAKRGAAHITGLDFAPSMVDFSKNAAQKMGFGEKCEFVCADFLAHRFTQKYDYVIAMGFFDYVKDASEVLGKIRTLTSGIFVASFPRHRFFWDIQRYIRYNILKKVDIYYYSKAQLEKLYTQAGFLNFSIIRIGAGFYVVAKVQG